MADATRPLRDPVVERYLPDVDRSLIRKNLALSVEERFLQLMELQRFAEELKRGVDFVIGEATARGSKS
jgi:hypothetical protein